MQTSPAIAIAVQHSREPIDMRDHWANIQYDAANQAAAHIVQVLAGQREHFDYCAAGRFTTPLNVTQLFEYMMRRATKAEMAMMMAGLVALDPKVRTNAISKAQEFIACLAGAHGDHVADRSAGVQS